MLKRILPFAVLSLLELCVTAQPEIELQLVTTGVDDIVDIAHAGDDRIFCVLSPGTIRIVQNGSLLPTPFLDITDRVVSGGERGLLGLTFDPNYAQNRWFYVHYTANTPGLTSRISRFTTTALNPDSADAASEEILYSTPQPFGNHNGGDVEFGQDSMLYISLGDGGGGGDTQNNAQTLSNPLGALLRIDVSLPGDTFLIPADNPFVNAGGDTLPEIWAYGLRNPWRIGFDALTGDLWLGDVGQSAWEEIDFWPAGDNSGPNFGWRCREGFVAYNMSGCGPVTDYVEPLAVHPNGPWCSIIGGRVYRGSEYPALYGHYIYTDYCEGEFHSLLPDGLGGWEQTMLAETQGQGFVVIAEDSALALYAGNRNTGTLYKIIDPMNVSTSERAAGPAFTIYPVPAGDRLIIEGELTSVAGIELIDLSGRSISQRAITARVTKAEMEVSALANGIYVIVLSDGEGREMARRSVSIVH